MGQQVTLLQDHAAGVLCTEDREAQALLWRELGQAITLNFTTLPETGLDL